MTHTCCLNTNREIVCSVTDQKKKKSGETINERLGTELSCGQSED